MTGLSLPSGPLGSVLRKPSPAPFMPVDSGRGVLLCILGPPGVGKSSVLSQFPNVKFVVDRRDQGILDLMDYSAATHVNLRRDQIDVASDYLDLKAKLEMAVTGPASSVVIESLVGIQALCDDKCLKEDFEGKINPFVNYQNGYVASSVRYFQPLLDLMILGQEKGKNIFLTGHSKVGSGKNVSGDDWVSQISQSSPAVARRIDATFANIFHIGSTVSTVKPSGKIRASGMSTSIYVDINPFFPAKNRMGLNGSIPYPSGVKESYIVLCSALSLDPLTGKRR